MRQFQVQHAPGKGIKGQLLEWLSQMITRMIMTAQAKLFAHQPMSFRQLMFKLKLQLKQFLRAVLTI